MSCGCNSTPCSCLPRPSICCTPTTESVEYTFENGGASGIGVFDNETDNLVQFRTVVSESVALTIALDAPNQTIVFDFDDTQLVAAIPDATTTQRGILETSTDAEALAKALNNKILTPSNLAALGGTSSFAGMLELATNAETITGTDTARATTPAGVAAAAALYRTRTFADAVSLNAGVPAFAGQFAAQVDTEQAFIAGSTAAGDWNPIFTFGVTQDTGGLSTSWFTTGTTILNGSGSGVLNFTAINANFLSGAQLAVETGSIFRMEAGSVFQINASAVPANSVILTGASNGELSSALISTFLSTANTTTYGIPSGTLARTTFTSYGGQTVSNPPTQAEVQTIDAALVIVSRRLAALITDLIVTSKPTA